MEDEPFRRDRRAAGTTLAVLATLLCAVPSGAQIYTRRNAKGVVEATNVPAARGYRLTYPGKGRVIHSSAYRLRRSYNGEFDHHIAAATSAYNVSLDLVRAIIQVESDFDHLARSSKGAQGLMQLMPRTAKAVGIEDPFDPRQNIFGGVKYLSQMLERYNGNTALALAAYNAGPGNVRRHRGVPPFRETRGYVSKIAKLLADSDAAFAVPAYRAPAKKARVSSRSARRAATVKKASMASRAKARKAKVTRTSARKAASKARARTTSRRASRT